MSTALPRPEHPNPQWMRSTWQNLNGSWEFEIDPGASALDRRRYASNEPLSNRILVPFCPESALSGIGQTDFMDAVLYRRRFTISKEALCGLVYLHFGAADYQTHVFVNGAPAGTHTGGYDSFCFEISALLHAGENTLFVAVLDDTRCGKQPSGKQSEKYASHGCYYTRTTGIWQTVWLEMTPRAHILYARYEPDVSNGALTVRGAVCGAGTLTIEASYEGRPMGRQSLRCTGGAFQTTLSLLEKHLWAVGQGNLYDLTLSFGQDRVQSYFGLRTVRMDGMRFMLNDQPVFQRLVLDQGFYPDGVYTAPTDAALKNDIALSLAMGFNGARLHQKVFEPRFLYHCDKMGYLVWGEHGNWGFDHHSPQATERYLNQWSRIVARDFNHPAIIGWCPFNETWGYAQNQSGNTLLSTIYQYTKAVDPTRPVIDASGNYHEITDIYDVHDYDQNPESFKAHYDQLFLSHTLYDQVNLRPDCALRQTYAGQPVFISEYGGIRWDAQGGSTGWGYGQAPGTPQEFLARYRDLTLAILNNPQIMGFCYTQLYDVEQEINGLYTYARQPKFDPAVIRKINTQPAAIEQPGTQE